MKISLGAGKAAYGLVLREPIIALYDREFDTDTDVDPSDIAALPIMTRLMVMNHAITSGRWPVLAKIGVPANLSDAPRFCKYDEISGELSIYQEIKELAPHYERPASKDECIGLETAAVWEPEHVEDRIRDHFHGRKNIWVEQLRIP